MSAPRLQGHRLSDPRPVRVTDGILQAEAFIGLYRRLGCHAELGAEFRRWAESKDFSARDRRLIAREIRRLLSRGKQGHGDGRRP